ncbi:unnamed protein product, partial [Bubo scandiacus]
SLLLRDPPKTPLRHVLEEFDPSYSSQECPVDLRHLLQVGLSLGSNPRLLQGRYPG